MKIRSITPIVVHASKWSNYIFVIIETDEGITGYGDATLDGLEFEVVAAVNNMAASLIGKDIFDTSAMPSPIGGGLITAAAVSGIDVALWDIKGKALGVPIYKLLGGAVKKEIPVYAAFNRYITDRTPEGFGKMAVQLVSEGNKAMKCHPFDNVSWRTPLANQRKWVDEGIARFVAMREAVGDDISIGLDAHWRFDFATAMYVAEKIRPYNPFWLETPIPEKKPELLREFRIQSGLTLAGAEMQTSAADVLPLLNQGCYDVYMPDIRYIGGITGMMKFAAVAETFDVLMSPHNMCSVITCAASLHCASTMKHLMHLEYHPPESPWLPELSDTNFTVQDGCFTVSDKPGLGVELNVELLKKYPYKKATPIRLNMLGG